MVPCCSFCYSLWKLGFLSLNFQVPHPLVQTWTHVLSPSYVVDVPGDRFGNNELRSTTTVVGLWLSHLSKNTTTILSWQQRQQQQPHHHSFFRRICLAKHRKFLRYFGHFLGSIWCSSSGGGRSYGYGLGTEIRSCQVHHGQKAKGNRWSSSEMMSRVVEYSLSSTSD